MATRPTPHVINEMQIFVSYAREDRRWLAEDSVVPWLKNSLEKSRVKLWWDNQATPGGIFSKEIAKQIDASQIAILLVTEEFLNSKYINDVELPRIAQRVVTEKMWVIPILVEACQWERSEFLRERTFIPLKEGKPTPLVAYRNDEHQWATVRNEILVSIEKAIQLSCTVPRPSVSKTGYLALVSLCVAGIIGLTGYFAFTTTRQGLEFALPILPFLAAMNIVLGITSLRLVYKMWAALRNEQPRMTPRGAVFGLLVPLVNLYWCFPVFLRFVKDYNKCIERNKLGLPLLSKRLFLTGLLLGVSTVIPFLGGLTLVPALGLYVVMVGKICDAINGLSAAQISSLPDFAPFLRRKPVIWWKLIVTSLVILAAFLGWKAGWIGPRQNMPGNIQPAGIVIQSPPLFVKRAGWRGKNGLPSSSDLANARAILAKPPNDIATLNDAGCMFLSAGQLQEGVALLSKAHALAPRDQEIEYNYARGLYQQGKPADALNQLEASIAQQPGFDEAQLLAAAIDVENGRLESAEGRLSKLIKTTVVIARVIQGAIALKRGKTAEGLAIFQSLLTEDPSNPFTQYNAGVANQQSGNFAEAQRLYQGALASNSRFAEAHYNLGTVFTQTHQMSAARSEFTEAIRLRPELGRNLQQKTTSKGERLNSTAATGELLRSIELTISRLIYGQTSGDLREQVTSGNVEAAFVTTGRGAGDTIVVQVRKQPSAPRQVLALSLAPGTVLSSADPNIRPLVVIGIRGRRADESHYIAESTIEIADTPATYIVSVVRLTAHGVDATENTPFALSKEALDPALGCIANKVQALSVAAAQAAVLIRTQRLTHERAKTAMDLDDSDWAAAQTAANSCM